MSYNLQTMLVTNHRQVENKENIYDFRNDEVGINYTVRHKTWSATMADGHSGMLRTSETEGGKLS